VGIAEAMRGRAGAREGGSASGAALERGRERRWGRGYGEGAGRIQTATTSPAHQTGHPRERRSFCCMAALCPARRSLLLAASPQARNAAERVSPARLCRTSLGGRCGRARCAGRAGTTAQRGAAGGAETTEARDAQAAARLGGGATALCAPICAAFAAKTAPPFLPLKALILRGWPGRSLAGHLAAWQARLRGRASEQHGVGAGGSGRSGERFPPFARSRQPEQWYQRRYSAS